MYKVQWDVDGSIGWVLDTDLSEEAKQEYHILHTREGRRRKHPLQRYFSPDTRDERNWTDMYDIDIDDIGNRALWG